MARLNRRKGTLSCKKLYIDARYHQTSMHSQITTPVAWNLTAPDLSILTPNAAERPDQAIVDLAVQVSSVSGIASLQFAFAPLGSGMWNSILNMLPIKPGTPVTPSGPGLAAAGVATWATSLSTTGLAAGKYDFRVIATDASGRTAQKLDTFDVGAAGARGPPTPGFTLNSTSTTTGVQLTWTGAAGDLFQVRRAFGSGSIFTSLGTTSASTFVDTAVLPGSSYQYQVVRLHINTPPSAQCRLPKNRVPQGTCWVTVQPFTPLPSP